MASTRKPPSDPTYLRQGAKVTTPDGPGKVLAMNASGASGPEYIVQLSGGTVRHYARDALQEEAGKAPHRGIKPLPYFGGRAK